MSKRSYSREGGDTFYFSQGSGTISSSAHTISGFLPENVKPAHDLNTQPSSCWMLVSYLSRSRLQTNPRRKHIRKESS